MEMERDRACDSPEPGLSFVTHSHSPVSQARLGKGATWMVGCAPSAGQIQKGKAV